MIASKNLTKSQFIDLKNRFHGTIFDIASLFEIWFDDTEIKYIETKMMTHHLYRLVSGKVAGIDCRDIAIRPLFKFQREWLLDFMNDPELPIGVQSFIYYLVGREQLTREKYRWFNDTTTARRDIDMANRFLAQRWMEKCR